MTEWKEWMAGRAWRVLLYIGPGIFSISTTPTTTTTTAFPSKRDFRWVLPLLSFLRGLAQHALLSIVHPSSFCVRRWMEVENKKASRTRTRAIIVTANHEMRKIRLQQQKQLLITIIIIIMKSKMTMMMMVMIVVSPCLALCSAYTYFIHHLWNLNKESELVHT